MGGCWVRYQPDGGLLAAARVLRNYEQRRNETARPGYEQNCAAASFVPPPPVILAQRAAARTAQQSVLEGSATATVSTAVIIRGSLQRSPTVVANALSAGFHLMVPPCLALPGGVLRSGNRLEAGLFNEPILAVH